MMYATKRNYDYSEVQIGDLASNKRGTAGQRIKEGKQGHRHEFASMAGGS